MNASVPWIITAFFVGFFTFQFIGYQTEKSRLEHAATIEGQAEALSNWLDLTPEQHRAYIDFRAKIVEKEKEFQDYRKEDAKRFFEANENALTADEKLRQIKERHLKILQQTKSDELQYWSDWIDMLTYDQRSKYLGKV